MQSVLNRLCVLILCSAVATGSPFYRRDRYDEDRYCRSGLYIHDSDNPVQSGICPRLVDCAKLLGLPARQIRCTVEFRDDLNNYPDVWSSTVLRFGCSRLADCPAESNQEPSRLCYRTSEVRDRYERYNSFFPLRLQLTSIEDGAFLCP